MKRTLLAAVIGGLITVVGGAFTAQAAPISVPNTTQAGTNLVQTVGYGYEYRRYNRGYRHRHWRHRPVVRYHYYRAPRRYVRPHYRYVRPYDWRWSHRYHRRHYY